MRQAMVVAALALLVGTASATDKLILKDGKVLDGKIVGSTERDIQIEVGGETQRIPRSAIEKIERERPAATGDTPKVGATASRGTTAAPAAARPAEPSPEHLAWVDVCVKQLSSKDDDVRASAAAALSSSGPVAVPALKKAAAGKDQTVATLAQRVLGFIERTETRMAQQTGGAGDPAERRADAVMVRLGLDAEQTKKYKAVFDEFDAKRVALIRSIRSGEIQVDEGSKQIAALRDTVDKQLAQVLNPEQMKQFMELLPHPEERTVQR